MSTSDLKASLNKANASDITKYKAALNTAKENAIKNSGSGRISKKALREETDNLYNDFTGANNAFNGSVKSADAQRGVHPIVDVPAAVIGAGRDFLNGVSEAGGNALDAAWDWGIGGLGDLTGLWDGQGARDLFTGEDASGVADLLIDTALLAVPGVGAGLVFGKNMIQNSDTVYEALTGKDSVTGEELSGDQRSEKGIEAALGTALAAVPLGAGKAAKVVGKRLAPSAEATDDAVKAGAEAASEATEASAKAGSEATEAAARAVAESAETAEAIGADTAEGAAKAGEAAGKTAEAVAKSAEESAEKMSRSEMKRKIRDAENKARDEFSSKFKEQNNGVLTDEQFNELKSGMKSAAKDARTATIDEIGYAPSGFERARDYISNGQYKELLPTFDGVENGFQNAVNGIKEGAANIPSSIAHSAGSTRLGSTIRHPFNRANRLAGRSANQKYMIQKHADDIVGDAWRNQNVRDFKKEISRANHSVPYRAGAKIGDIGKAAVDYMSPALTTAGLQYVTTGDFGIDDIPTAALAAFIPRSKRARIGLTGGLGGNSQLAALAALDNMETENRNYYDADDMSYFTKDQMIRSLNNQKNQKKGK